MDGSWIKWGFTEVPREDNIPYVRREKRTMDGAALEEEVGDDMWHWAQARKLKVMIHGRALL